MRLVLTAATVFLVPLLVAVGGAVWGGSSAGRQAAGAFSGLALGLAMTAVLAGRIRPRP